MDKKTRLAEIVKHALEEQAHEEVLSVELSSDSGLEIVLAGDGMAVHTFYLEVQGGG